MVASKVYYHLGSFEDALTYALGASDLFDVNARNEYVDTVIAKCIDFYIQQRIAIIENPTEAKPIDERLEAIVNRMIQRCLDDGQYRQALGIALETRRMDIFEQSIMQSDDIPNMLNYAFQVTMSLIQSRSFRNTVLRSLVGLYRGLGTPDYVSMCQCLIFLEDPLAVAEILDKLTKSEEYNVLMSYQIGFDLYESATQQFLGQVLQALKATAPIPSALISTMKPQGTETAAAPVAAGEEDITENKPEEEQPLVETKPERTVDSLVSFFKIFLDTFRTNFWVLSFLGGQQGTRREVKQTCPTVLLYHNFFRFPLVSKISCVKNLFHSQLLLRSFSQSSRFLHISFLSSSFVDYNAIRYKRFIRVSAYSSSSYCNSFPLVFPGFLPLVLLDA